MGVYLKRFVKWLTLRSILILFLSGLTYWALDAGITGSAYRNDTNFWWLVAIWTFIFIVTAKNRKKSGG